HFEVAKHYTLNEHSMSPEVLVMSKRSWDGLTADERKMFHDAAKESVAVMRKLWFEREKKSEAMVRQAGSMIVDKVDKRPFIDAMKPVYDRFVTDAKMKTLVARIQAVQ
ncbi:MAG: TRAP transporter substrate-binding protein, partial [Alphaproteobacteria bacterium]|nr:TRAP transporter substrate-binding protein [Alphaproteobacteria bacterium]